MSTEKEDDVRRVLTIRIPEELAKQVEVLANEDLRSFNNTVWILLREAIEAREAKKNRGKRQPALPVDDDRDPLEGNRG